MRKIMCFILSVALLVLSGCNSPVESQKTEPIPVILDTDMGNDIDDAFALYMIMKYQDMGKCKLLCVAHNKDNPNSVVATDVFLKACGRSANYCAVASGTGSSHNDGWYLKEVCEKQNPDGTYVYPRSIKKENSVPESVSALRKILAESKDNSVVYISVGFSTNIANLLKSKPDSISNLSGRELVAKKVKYFSVMAGDFSKKGLSFPAKAHKEFNIHTDVPSAEYFFANCPSPIYFSGFFFGASIRYPRSEIDSFFGEKHPVYEAYDTSSRKLHRKIGKFDWASFDMTSVLFVFEPELFKLSENGTASVFDKEGRVTFTSSKDGKHRYFLPLEEPQRNKIRERIIEMSRLK